MPIYIHLFSSTTLIYRVLPLKLLCYKLEKKNKKSIYLPVRMEPWVYEGLQEIKKTFQGLYPKEWCKTDSDAIRLTIIALCIMLKVADKDYFFSRLEEASEVLKQIASKEKNTKMGKTS
jgi:hypothetical protein